MTNKYRVTILDGGMGRELERRGAPFQQPEWSATSLVETPEIVEEVHRAFIQSGAQMITTNSYALVPFHIGEQRFAEQAQILAFRSGSLARNAAVAEGKNTQIAGSIPPLFGSYRADLYQADRAEEIATPIITGLALHVDLWLAETQSLIEEALTVHSLVRKLDGDEKPFWVSFTVKDEPTAEPQLRSGETVKEAVQRVAQTDISAILFNCSQPEVIEDALKVARKTLEELNKTEIQLGAYANAFPPQKEDAQANGELSEMRQDLTEKAYVQIAEQWAEQGATLIGGCCGIGPEYIQALSENPNFI